MKITRFIVCWLIFLSFCGQVHSQQYRTLFDSVYSQLNEKATRHLEKLVASQLAQYGKEEAAKMSHDFSVGYYFAGNYAVALRFGLKEIALLEVGDSSSNAYNKAIYQVGFLNEKSGDYKKAISYYEKVIDLNIDQEYIARSYCRIGSCYDDLGDLYKALDYYNEGILRLEEQKSYGNLARNYNNLAILHNKIGTQKSLTLQLKTLRKAESLQQYITLSPSRLAVTHNLLGDYYNNKPTFNFDSARFHYNIALKNASQIQNSSRLHATLVNLGILYSKEQQDSAAWFLHESLKFPVSNDKRVYVYRALSDFFIAKGTGHLEDALKYINKAIAINLFNDENFYDKPINKTLLKNAVNPDEALSAIITRTLIKIKQYDLNKELSLINDALNNIYSADTLADLIQQESSEELSKLHWRRRASEVYSKGILCAQLLNKDDVVFYFSEKTKALLLTENILSKAKNDSLPKKVKSQANFLKKELIKWQNKLKQVKSKTDNRNLQKELYSSKLKYQQFLDSIKLIYPEYYAKLSNIALVSLAKVQQQLPEDLVVISYVWDTDLKDFDNLYGLLVSKNSSQSFRINQLSELTVEIEKMRALLSKPFETNADLFLFRKISHRLFQTLFPSNSIREFIKNKRLLILPDNQLHNIPFDALVTNESSGSYLIAQNEISYSFSMSFQFYNQSIIRKASRNFIGVSPVNFDYDSLIPIDWSGVEIDKIQSILHGKAVKQGAATKSNFINESIDYKIIHLATHTNSGSNPWIAFSDQKMYIDELYNTKSNADLIFLSSCNTTTGDIAEGEGILNMSRAFFHTGANSVVSTLWNINDKSAFFITSEFYQNLKNGYSKSAALRQAKLKYIEANSLSDVSPFYWSSFVLIGDNGEVKVYAKKWGILDYIVFLSSILLITTLLFIFLKKIKNLW